MRKLTGFLIAGLVSTGFIGCATVPDKSELQRLDRAAFSSKFVGNTYTRSTEYGRWAEFFETRKTGYGRAWGDWGSQHATSTYTIAADGEWCVQYSGDHEWSTAEHEYCSVAYTDKKGNVYVETTKDTWEPQTEGEIARVTIKNGDEYGLKEEAGAGDEQ